MNQNSSINMRAACYVSGGGADKLSVELVPLPVLQPGDVLLKVFASAINRADIIQRLGKYPPPKGASEILGLEAAGTVEKSESNSKWKEGDRVMALLAGGGYAEYVAVPQTHLIPIPSTFSWPHAAAIPEAWLTAFQLLYFVAKINANSTVLVHAAASGVGTAAVQLITKLFNSTVFATAGSQTKCNFVIDLGAKYCFNYKTDDFAQKIAEITNGRGVDIVLDCVGGSYWQKNLDSIAVDGCWVLYGLMGGADIDGPLLRGILSKRIRLEGTGLRTRSDEYKAELIARFTEMVIPLFENGALKPIVDSLFPFGKLADAHQFVEDNKNIGKVILLIRGETEPVDSNVEM